jgi:two-component system, NtrC family, response regulator AtoC
MKTSKRPVILVVDDDKSTRDGLNRALADSMDVITAEGGAEALRIMEGREVDIMLTDMRMPDMDGIMLMQRALGRTPGLVCILLTAYGSVEAAVEAMKQGAYDFLTKPVNLDHLDMLLKRALRSRDMESENAALREQLDRKFGMENIVGSSPVMNQLFEVIRQAAPTQATVLVQGESGTGKELVAQAIHRLSTRAKGPFVGVHCAALSPTILESELFGHEKGAFTGAIGRRRGRFEMADGGTLFLDEISEIEPSVQVKLLRVLEERRFERVGGTETVEVDLRLITATNRNLRQLVEEGKFRDDLFFRLDVVSITIPPLRDRVEDIPILCDHFLREFASKNSKNVEGISADAAHLLSAYSWPGNVRELRNTIEKMVVLTGSKKLTAKDVPVNIKQATGTAGISMAGLPAGKPISLLADAEEKMIFAALKKHDDNISKAAQELGISRRTIHRKLNQYREQRQS